MLKNMLCILICVIMLFAIVPFTVFASDNTYKQGDIIEFGSYPRSQVTDVNLINELNKLEVKYIENNNESLKCFYGDIEHNNEKYRAVRTAENETVDWYIFEPIEWYIVDPENGYILCNSVLDAHPFKYNSVSFSDNWADSDIRAMLNNDFYNTAFSSAEKENIVTTETTVQTVDGGQLSNVTVSDEVVLFSLDDVLNDKYSFIELSGHREGTTQYYVVSADLCREASDYALKMGASACLEEAIEKNIRGVKWLLNSNRGYDNRPTVIHEQMYNITYTCYNCGPNHSITGDFCAMDSVGDYCNTSSGETYGICPAMHINLETFNKENIAGDLDGNGTVTPSDARTALRIAAGLETATDDIRAIADIDSSGDVTPSDARTILRIAAGLE